MASENWRRKLWRCLSEGLAAGARTAAWLLALMVPISLGVTLLHWSGALAHLARFLGPVFALIDLPREAALPFLAGALVNCYTGVAATGALPLTERQVTILALMILISHNLLVEVSVQRKAGSSGIGILSLRLGTSAVAGVFLSFALPAGPGAASLHGAATAASSEFADVMAAWGENTMWLCAKIVVLIVGLMIFQRVIQEFGVTRWLARLLAPALWLMGLPRRAAFLWVVGNTLGLAYGAGVLLDETSRGTLPPEEAELLNRSLAVCHSLLEDTLLFVAIGAWPLWIIAPRVALAAVAVWSYRLWRAVA